MKTAELLESLEQIKVFIENLAYSLPMVEGKSISRVEAIAKIKNLIAEVKTYENHRLI